ncbi:hypothetical protein [Hirschia maritima]|uniref:hypothetical protein n=1 Tax=Hirschia maritima TaxID=1121961 RepID=UPI0012DE66F2|nr:hypothetical protein [Hirschia maritima]
MSIQVQSERHASSDIHHSMDCDGDETPTNHDEDCPHCEYNHVLKSDTSFEASLLPSMGKTVALTAVSSLPAAPIVKPIKEPRFQHLAQGPPTPTPVTLKIRLLN